MPIRNIFFFILIIAGISLSGFLLIQMNGKHQKSDQVIDVNRVTGHAFGEERDEAVLEFPDGSYIDVEVVSTHEKRSKGLSGREKLGPAEGMLFVFEVPGTYGFWVKDMNFAIDIVWLDEKGEIVHIESDIAPETYPTSFRSEKKALFVLEMVAGSVDNYGLQVGDRITLLRGDDEAVPENASNRG